MTRLRIGFDLDGVLYDFGKSVRAYLDSIGRSYGWKDNADEPHTWNFFEYWGMDVDEFKQICNDGVDAGYIFSDNIRPGAWRAVKDASRYGDIVIITDRQFGKTPEASHRATRNWLEMWDIQYDELVFSADKTKVHTDIFVEDKLENFRALWAAGTPCYLINRPWNEAPDQEILEGWPAMESEYRIDDVSDYPDKVAELYLDISYADVMV